MSVKVSSPTDLNVCCWLQSCYITLLSLWKSLKRTSPSGEKFKAEIAVTSFISELAASKFGSPGGPVASKILIFIILH